jgi:hypothetical protein
MAWWLDAPARMESDRVQNYESEKPPRPNKGLYDNDDDDDDKNKTNSVAFSPHANYTNWATATCRRNLAPTFADRGVSRCQRGGSHTVVNLSFLDRSRYFSFK